MERGAYGIMPAASGARFSDGQRWLDGSAPEFEQMLDRQGLDGFFPALVGVERRLPPDWENREGAIHVVAPNQHWYVVHCFQPGYSIARTVPLWLCIRMSREEFSSSMMLAAAVADLDQCRRRLDRDPMSLLRWLAAGAIAPGAPAGIDEVRTASALHDALLRNTVMAAPAIDDAAYWRALQVLFEGWRERYEGFRALLRLEPSGSLPSPSPCDPTCLFEVGRGSTPTAQPFAIRGVGDESMLSALGLHRLVGQAINGLPGSGAASFASRVCVPAELLAYEELREDEEEAWARARWREAGDAEDCIRTLASRVSAQGMGRARAIRVLARVLLSDPALPQAGVDLAERRLRQVMAAGSSGTAPAQEADADAS